MPQTFRLRRGLHLRLNGQGELSVEKRLPDGTLQMKNLATGEYTSMTEEQILKAWCDGALEILGDEQGTLQAERRAALRVATDISLLNDEVRAEIKRRFAYVSAVRSRRVDKPSNGRLVQIIHDVGAATQDASPPSSSTLRRWCKRYVASGEDLLVLAPALKRRGNYKCRLAQGDEQKSNEIAKLIDDVIAEKYLSRERPAIAAIYDMVVNRISSVNEFRDACDRLPIPHLNSVYKIVRKLDPYLVAKARHGQPFADQKFSPVGHAPRPSRPLERVEMDHTKIDLMVIDPVMRLPVGRPLLTTALDKFTATVLGKYISFNPAGYLSVMHCLRHAIIPKTYLREKYPNIVNDWDAYGIPECIVVDNGAEFHSKHLEDACLQLGIIIQYAPPKRPSYKGSQERWFGTQNKQLLHKQPGTTFSNILDRGDYDPKKNAVITFDALDEMYHTYIVDVYHQQEHRGIRDVPARLWKAAVAEYPPAMPPHRTSLDVLLGCVAERTISRKGIELHGGGLFYNDDALAVLRRSLKPGERVTLKYDPSDLSMIHVADRARGLYIPVPATNQQYAQGLSLWQHEVIKSYARRVIRESVDMIALCQAKLRIQEIVEREWLSAKRTGTRARLARLKNHGGEKQLELRSAETSQDRLSSVNIESHPSLLPAEPGNAGEVQPARRKSARANAKAKALDNDAAPSGEDLDLTGWEANYDLPK